MKKSRKQPTKPGNTKRNSSLEVGVMNYPSLKGKGHE
jgi:hypothetical protein